jgi:hypothetical protein
MKTVVIVSVVVVGAGVPAGRTHEVRRLNPDGLTG